MPAADIDVTPQIVRALLASSCPELADREITLAANGWDCVMFRLGADLAVRLPRRQASAALVDVEARWLPVLAAGLPLPVPVPVHVGEPAAFYPWRWTIVPWFEGRAVGAAPLADPTAAARSLGTFVAALHRPAPHDHPVNAARGIPLARRVQTTAAHAAAFDGPAALKARIDAAWGEALDAPEWDGPPMWLHGDLHPANIIVSDDVVAAVVDFGDLTAGDPATDLLCAWTLFDRARRADFRRHADSVLRPIDDAMWARGRGWAIAHGLAVVASSADDPEMHAIGLRTLEAAAER